MATVSETVRRVVETYAVPGANFRSFLTSSDDGKLLTVVDIAIDDKGKRFTATSLIVRFVGEKVVIEQDDNDKRLVDALLQAGLSRTQIVLAYAGETVPEAA